jgi:RimJ/RimL family protein N-acetyltransferase
VPSPYTKDDAFAWVALAESMLRQGTAYHLVIVDAGDGALLGSAGLEIHDAEPPHGEIGYWVAAPARGRGVATRAVRLLTAWAVEACSLPMVEIHVLPANRRSHEVARKAGFAPAGKRLLPFRGRIEDFDIYALDAPLDAPRAADVDRPGA